MTAPGMLAHALCVVAHVQAPLHCLADESSLLEVDDASLADLGRDAQLTAVLPGPRIELPEKNRVNFAKMCIGHGAASLAEECQRLVEMSLEKTFSCAFTTSRSRSASIFLR